MILVTKTSDQCMCVVLDSKMVGFHSKLLCFSDLYLCKQVLKFCLRRQIYAVRTKTQTKNSRLPRPRKESTTSSGGSLDPLAYIILAQSPSTVTNHVLSRFAEMRSHERTKKKIWATSSAGPQGWRVDTWF